MSFNRLMYDKCESEKNVDESAGPGLYQIDTPKMCNPCYQDNPNIRLQKNGDSITKDADWRYYAGPIDIDSELRNINRPISRCPSDKYEPVCSDCTCKCQGQPCGQGVVGGCQKKNGKLRKLGERCNDNQLVDFPICHFNVEDTRQSNPPETLRGTGWNRFQPLCLNPQEQVLFPAQYQIPTRLVVKDNHRPCVPTPAVNNMLPKPHKLPCPNTQPVCGAYTSPMYQYDVCG